MNKGMAGSLMVAAVVALALVGAPGVSAKKKAVQDIDFSRLSCQDFVNDMASASEDDAGAVLLWLDGYLSGVSGDTVLSFSGLESFSVRLVERCAKRGRERLLDAARAVGLQ